MYFDQLGIDQDVSRPLLAITDVVYSYSSMMMIKSTFARVEPIMASDKPPAHIFSRMDAKSIFKRATVSHLQYYLDTTLSRTLVEVWPKDHISTSVVIGTTSLPPKGGQDRIINVGFREARNPLDHMSNLLRVSIRSCTAQKADMRLAELGMRILSKIRMETGGL